MKKSIKLPANLINRHDLRKRLIAGMIMTNALLAQEQLIRECLQAIFASEGRERADALPDGD
jgi:hypothetical protein